MKLKYEYKNQIIEFDLIYRKIKTMAIQIKPPKEIRVLAPSGLSKLEILHAVEKKSDWIVKKLAYYENIDYEIAVKKFSAGEIFKYLGRDYILRINLDRKCGKTKIILDDDYIIITINEMNVEKMKTAMEIWYREKAEKVIKERVAYFQKYIEVKPCKVRIKTQKRRWGSCTSNRDMYFNWKLAMAPIDIIDYVVLHEMSHLVHMNHSAEFWDFLLKLMPDYKIRKDWLKKNGFRLEM